MLRGITSMYFSDAQKKKINKSAQKIIKSAGNQVKGNILEACLVLDCSLESTYLNQAAGEVLTSLRKLGSPFLNMRLNLIKWRSNDDMATFVTSYPEVMLGISVDDKDLYLEPGDKAPGAEDEEIPELLADVEATSEETEIHFEETNITEENVDSQTEDSSKVRYNYINHEKTWDKLFLKINKEYTRSKLVIILTKKERELENASEVKDTVLPVFPKKLLFIYPDGSSKTPFKFPKDTDLETMLEEAEEVSYDDLAPDTPIE